MRAGFGLVSILVAIGLIAWMMGKGFGTSALTDPGVKHQTANAQQFAGYGRDGEMRFSQSLTLDPQNKNGKTTSVLVTSVAAGGPAEIVFGLKKDDAIVEIGPLGVDQIVQSDSDAMAFIQDAYQKMQTLTVIRNGQKITLSAAEETNKPKTAANAPGKANATNSSNPASPANNNSNNPLGDQVDLTSPTR